MSVKVGDCVRFTGESDYFDRGAIYTVTDLVGYGNIIVDNPGGPNGIYYGEYEIITEEVDSMEKAQVGDLIRIVNALPERVAYKNGDIFEVTHIDSDGAANFVDYFGVEAYSTDTEYVIHRKAGEEDSDQVGVVRELREQKMRAYIGEDDSESYCDNCGLEEVNGDCAHCSEEYEPSKWSDTQPNLIRLAGEELTELLVRKNHDYGDSFSQQYAKYGALSAMIRMDDKMRRLETLIGGEQAHVDESLADTLLDLAGYALLAYVETQKK